MSQTSKTELRQQARSNLRILSIEEIACKSGAVREHLSTHVLCSLPAGAGVALFGGLRSEVDLLPLLSELTGRNLRAFYFRIAGDCMVAVEVQNVKDLKRGTMGVWEPVDSLPALGDLARLAVVLTPGLGFDSANGARLGRGAGYYDRFLSQPTLHARRIGVGFDCQLMTGIPMAEHDVPMDAVITESGIAQALVDESDFERFPLGMDAVQ